MRSRSEGALEDFRDRVALVTGGTGALGSTVVRDLLVHRLLLNEVDLPLVVPILRPGDVR